MKQNEQIKLIECPRDAMQGLHDFIPTEQKAEYINALLTVGFDTIDFGSFVSPKAIPQMRDTAKVLEQLKLDESSSKLLAIIANQRGADDAVQFEEISYLGFPFSISPTFQQRNTNANQQEAFERIEGIQELCMKHNKQMVVYLSMAFGNPYEDAWNVEEIEQWAEKFAGIEIPILALADTVGIANPEIITKVFSDLIPKYEQIEFGAHFHSKPTEWKEKIDAAYKVGCRRFDSTINGIGGCPMAKDELVGNIATENILHLLKEKELDLSLNFEQLNEAQRLAKEIFG